MQCSQLLVEVALFLLVPLRRWRVRHIPGKLVSLVGAGLGQGLSEFGCKGASPAADGSLEAVRCVAQAAGLSSMISLPLCALMIGQPTPD